MSIEKIILALLIGIIPIAGTGIEAAKDSMPQMSLEEFHAHMKERSEQLKEYTERIEREDRQFTTPIEGLEYQRQRAFDQSDDQYDPSNEYNAPDEHREEKIYGENSEFPEWISANYEGVRYDMTSEQWIKKIGKEKLAALLAEAREKNVGIIDNENGYFVFICDES